MMKNIVFGMMFAVAVGGAASAKTVEALSPMPRIHPIPGEVFVVASGIGSGPTPAFVGVDDIPTLIMGEKVFFVIRAASLENGKDSVTIDCYTGAPGDKTSFHDTTKVDDSETVVVPAGQRMTVTLPSISGAKIPSVSFFIETATI